MALVKLVVGVGVVWPRRRRQRAVGVIGPVVGKKTMEKGGNRIFSVGCVTGWPGRDDIIESEIGWSARLTEKHRAQESPTCAGTRRSAEGRRVGKGSNC